MANTDAPFGLRPVRHMSGAPYNGAFQTFHIPATDSDAAAYVGALVKLTGAGYQNSDGQVLPVVTANVSTGDAVVGVVVGAEPVDQDSKPWRVNGTARNVYVCTDPDILFEVQEDSVGGALAVGAMGGTAQLTGFTSGNDRTGLSSIEIDSSLLSETGDTDDDVQIIGFPARPDNEIGANAKWLVRLNNHAFIDAATGV